MKLIKSFAILCIFLLLVGCNNKLSGSYKGNSNTFFDQLNFTSNNTVELVFMGATKEAEYRVKDHKIYITTAGETQIFTMNNNCLDGGGFIGTYCKN
jgi:hypothetical protein|uniref:hypothetical protein n=1 Tax=Gelidibacter sp. TaxID=2018083 RepID=UPI00404A2930